MSAEMDAYDRLRAARPELFGNPQDAATEILFDVADPAEERVIYQDSYVLLVRDRVRFRDGREGGYIRLIHAAGSPGAAVLPFYRGDILLLKHFRHTTRTWHWEIPRGFASAGETPMETASREATEELGVSPERLRRVGGIHTDTGLTPAVVELFVADVRSLGSPERTEGIDLIQAVSPARFDDMARAGEVTDSFTIAAVALARLHGLI